MSKNKKIKVRFDEYISSQMLEKQTDILLSSEKRRVRIHGEGTNIYFEFYTEAKEYIYFEKVENGKVVKKGRITTKSFVASMQRKNNVIPKVQPLPPPNVIERY